MTLLQQLFSNLEVDRADLARSLDADVQVEAPRLLDAAEVMSVAGGPQSQNDG